MSEDDRVRQRAAARPQRQAAQARAARALLGRPAHARVAGDPPCPHYPRCDGCPLIGQPYTEQLRRKHERVVAVLAAALPAGPSERAAIGPAAAVDGRPEVLPMIGSRSPFGYRNQAKLVLRRVRGRVIAGLYAPGTHRVVDVRSCPVHHPAINGVVAAAIELMEAANVSIYDEDTGTGALRYLVVRYSFWLRQSQVILVAAETPAGLGRLVRDLRRRCRTLRSSVLNINPSRGNVIFGPRWLALGGAPAILERMDRLTLQARAGSFIQANPWVAGRLYRTAGRWAGIRDTDTVADLYAGIGGLALTLAPAVRRVYAIEENEIAVGDARSNARRNGIGNVRGLAGAVESVLPQLRHDIGRADVVTLNPPRSGVADAVVPEIAALEPRAVLYLSCDPTTLARDLARLHAHGYRTVRVQPADMLPQTAHVECLALAVPDSGAGAAAGE